MFRKSSNRRKNKQKSEHEVSSKDTLEFAILGNGSQKRPSRTAKVELNRQVRPPSRVLKKRNDAVLHMEYEAPLLSSIRGVRSKYCTLIQGSQKQGFGITGATTRRRSFSQKAEFSRIGPQDHYYFHCRCNTEESSELECFLGP